MDLGGTFEIQIPAVMGATRKQQSRWRRAQNSAQEESGNHSQHHRGSGRVLVPQQKTSGVTSIIQMPETVGHSSRQEHKTPVKMTVLPGGRTLSQYTVVSFHSSAHMHMRVRTDTHRHTHLLRDRYPKRDREGEKIPI